MKNQKDPQIAVAGEKEQVGAHVDMIRDLDQDINGHAGGVIRGETTAFWFLHLGGG